MTTYPNAAITRAGAAGLLAGDDPHIWYTSPDGNSRFYLSGPLAPWPGIHDGVVLGDGVSGMTPDFQHILIKTARQDGETWQGVVYDSMKTQLTVSVHSRTPAGLSRVWAEWVGAWLPSRAGTFEYITPDRGYWYANVRLAKRWPDTAKQFGRTLREMTVTHTIINDAAFWFGMPSIDSFQPGGTGGSGHLILTNIGSQDAYPTLLFAGPGTFTVSNGDSAGTSASITVGPLLAGQVVLLDCSPRKYRLVDITAPSANTQNTVQKIIGDIVNFVTNDNVPPVVAQIESLFGVQPPQGPLATLLQGQFTNPLPGVGIPEFAQRHALAVSIRGGNADSRIVARIDPARVSSE